MSAPHIVVITTCSSTLASVVKDLSAYGCRVFAATCPIYSNHLIYGPLRPDLILVEQDLPLMRGDRKVRAIKRRRTSADIPVILMAAGEQGALQALAAAAGADGYLLRPFTPRTLLDRVQPLLSQWTACAAGDGGPDKVGADIYL